MDKTVQIKFNNNSDYELIKKILKMQNIVEESLSLTSYNVAYKEFDVTIYYEKEKTEEDELALKKEIELLENSINKRKGLLNNANFVAKAPANLVEQEKEKLKLEEEKLQKLKGE